MALAVSGGIPPRIYDSSYLLGDRGKREALSETEKGIAGPEEATAPVKVHNRDAPRTSKGCRRACGAIAERCRPVFRGSPSGHRDVHSAVSFVDCAHLEKLLEARDACSRCLCVAV